MEKEIDDNEESNEERNYWLLKAEPETRITNGVDVKFSIDDLAAKTGPEPWDGKSFSSCTPDLVMSVWEVLLTR